MCSNCVAGAVQRHQVARSARGVDVERLRATLGLTPAQLASAAGISERTVQNWEAGRVSPQAERVFGDLVELKETLTT